MGPPSRRSRVFQGGGTPARGARVTPDGSSDRTGQLRYATGDMDLRDRPEDSAFRAEIRQFLQTHLVGEFADLGGRGGSGDETFGFEARLRWERVLAEGGWTCLGWPV